MNRLEAAYRMDVRSVLEQIGSKSDGLTTSEAQRRLDIYGSNALTETGVKSRWKILLAQFTDTMVVILILAAIVSALLGDLTDAVTILAIVILNALLGYSQEYKAEQAMAALRKLAVPHVKVLRDGQLQEISATELVPGDIVLLEAGQIVPADCRLTESANLKIQESALTGESEAVEKNAHFVAKDDLPLGDRVNMAFMGTVVTYGRGQAVVVSTGMQTELGRIATLIQKVEREATPLQKRLDRVGKGLLKIILGIVLLICGLGMLRGENLATMLMTGVSIAVAAVPEALPAVLTITLALGAQRMLRRHALIRKLPAVETLGSVTVICSDKTGTLTENRMTVVLLDLPGQEIDLREQSANSQTRLLLAGAALCNDAVFNTEAQAMGDPTETALLVAAQRMGLSKESLEAQLPRVEEKPFDSERKLMTTLHRAEPGNCLGLDGYVSFTKGAVDSMLEICNWVWTGSEEVPLDSSWRTRILKGLEKSSRRGLRVLGVGYRKYTTVTDELERQLTFIGMIGMIDPPRPEVKNAVAKCRTAGIRTVMITGDHPLTASAIASELGFAETARVVTGRELEAATDSALEEIVQKTSIYARVSPEHKLRIVQALQKNGQIVAMTGDGVNDAPALKKSDIGVAMGITGTDVSKEASDIVLLDDNFATIVAAVEEGRVIYDNIRKYIKQTLTGNSGAIWLMMCAPFLGLPLPLTPIQILWVNLVADGLPSVTLGLETAERNIMERLPNNPNESIFGGGMSWKIVAMSLLLGAILIVEGWWFWQQDNPNWQTMVLTTLIFARMSLILSVKSWQDSLFTRFFTNIPLLGAVSLTILLHLSIVYLAPLQRVFGTHPLQPSELMVTVFAGVLPLAGTEIFKLMVRLGVIKD